MPDDWVREELERAAREEIHGYLASEATRFACGDGICTWEFNRRMEHLEWIERIAEAIGRDKAKAIWDAVEGEMMSGLADEARCVVGDRIADAWLAGAEIASCLKADAEIFAALGVDDLPDIIPPFEMDTKSRAAVGDDLADLLGDERDIPARMVQDGLRFIITTALSDRDLFDQLGLPESLWGGRM